ncbi:hypothetical protein BJN42_20770 [Pseudomonas koreensis]|nr:hypothetical protein BJN42_20770 [Pseudomonas koreensis]
MHKPRIILCCVVGEHFHQMKINCLCIFFASLSQLYGVIGSRIDNNVGALLTKIIRHSFYISQVKFTTIASHNVSKQRQGAL